MREKFIRKCDTFVTKYNSYYKLRQFHNNHWQLLQNAAFITNYDYTISLLSSFFEIYEIYRVKQKGFQYFKKWTRLIYRKFHNIKHVIPG